MKFVRHSIKKGNENCVDAGISLFGPRGAQGPIDKGCKYSIFNNVGRLFNDKIPPVNLGGFNRGIGGDKKNKKGPGNWRAPVFKNSHYFFYYMPSPSF